MPTSTPAIPSLRRSSRAVCTLMAGVLAACASAPEVLEGPPRKENVIAVTASNQLIRFNAGQPARILSTVALTGMQSAETVLGIDFRIAKGQLYALGSSGHLYRIDATTGVATPVGSSRVSTTADQAFGFDFNPTVDRIRVVSDSGLNLRLHPDTGAQVDGNPTSEGVQADGALAYIDGDVHAGKAPGVVAAAYTYNKTNEKITTNYVLDAASGALAMQGSAEGSTPVVSPNTGQLRTIGPLGAGSFQRASFDIADLSGVAYAALTDARGRSSRWVEIDLKSGTATALGVIGGGERIQGVAIEP